MFKKEKKLTREEQAQQQNSQKFEKLLFSDFQKCILDFQYEEHIKFLKNFLEIFKSVDIGKHGVIDEPQFIGLLEIMNEVSKEKIGENLVDSPDEMNYLLQ